MLREVKMKKITNMGSITIYNPFKSQSTRLPCYVYMKTIHEKCPLTPPHGRDFNRHIFLDNLLYIYLISASLHSRY